MSKILKNKKQQLRVMRHKKIRTKFSGTAERPRLSIYKSNRSLLIQLIDDKKGITLLSLSDQKATGKSKTERAAAAGKQLATEAVKKGINEIVFDRGGFKYQGRIKAFAEAARLAGLKF